MGRQENISYVCDWCGATSIPGSRESSDMPENWGYIDSTHEILCETCHATRDAAIFAARKARKATAKASEGT